MEPSCRAELFDEQKPEPSGTKVAPKRATCEKCTIDPAHAPNARAGRSLASILASEFSKATLQIVEPRDTHSLHFGRYDRFRHCLIVGFSSGRYIADYKKIEIFFYFETYL